jgi:16S rRNA (uracil1498-N3)-methyltransferase
MDLVIQKTTELGIKGIIPLITERSLIRETRKVNRWRKIAEEAAEQCGRAFIPVVHEPKELHSMFAVPHPMKGLVFWEGGGLALSEATTQIIHMPAPLPDNSTVHLIIGPEGGLASEEVKLAEDSGLVRTTLGRRILRAETAAIAAVALIQYLFEFCYNNGKTEGALSI